MKIILTVCLIALGMLVSIGVMINGWGLEAEDWGWIIGGSLVSVILTAIGMAIGADD